jgi:phosphoribosylformylglycinamidine cyclo-ligase
MGAYLLSGTNSPLKAASVPPVRKSLKPVTYASAGVDIASGDKTKSRIGELARATYTKSVLAGVGGFGALYQLPTRGLSNPVLVSSADGVGTKLKLAFELGIHSTVGQDLVNHCVNDIAVQGATPLFMLDYLATGRLDPKVIEQVVEGLSIACRQNGCSLIGGETAQMPGFYNDNEYDLAGFIVGIVEKESMITGAAIEPGEVLLGLPSTGLHTNGYSLARKLFFEVAGYKPKQRIPALKQTVADALLAIHRSYLPVIQRLVRANLVSGMAHITGGGITENLPRILPKGIAARVQLGSWPVLPLFNHLQELGSVSQEEMLRTFNLGIGLIAVIPSRKLPRVKRLLTQMNEPYYIIGNTEPGLQRVLYA